ncbi:germination protein YpeB [Petroclostridium sp. X23]|uniref:germination protein YpeB n=1 Tax=Petroclostridium sp. X23 TaxID=3045146 RepID=UPI0024AD3E2D|nr:germination protein YpeB [Petroclostridium sp. X23]WHH57365.1 germination protein YpeB [Petroclostridium sp. X23]
MGIRKKLQDFKSRLSDRHMYSIVLVVTAVIATAGIYQYKKALNYRNYVENQYNRSFHELVNYVENLETSLAKGMLVNSPDQMVVLSSEIWRKAAFAQANIGQLPISHVQLDKTSKFLTQVGDYTFSLSRKALNKEEITDKEYAQLEQLHKYADTLSKTLNNMQDDLYAGRLKFGELQQEGRKYFSKAAKNISVTKIENIEKEFVDYPSLIYDGPFSDHIERMDPRLLKGATEMSQEKARDKAVSFIGGNRAKNVENTGESNGAIKTYTFAMSPDQQQNGNKDRRISISITKMGGHVLWMLDNRDVSKSSMDIDEAKKKAKAFLEAQGYKSMKESYYIKNDGIATINYAYVQDDIIIYPDLIKVKVALDNGEIVGFESQGYIMAHQDTRKLPPIKVTEEAAKQKINKRLTIDSGRMAVIPLESKREVLCYEFKGKFDDKNFLVYINAETGQEEKILLLLETPNGILTM